MTTPPVVGRPEYSIFIPSVFESIFITVKSINTTLGVIYTSPLTNKTDFTDQYRRTLNLLSEQNENIVLLEDFNVNLMNFNRDCSVNEFVNLKFERYCVPLITKPTRVTPTSATCIDNIIANRISPLNCIGILKEDISGVLLFICT